MNISDTLRAMHGVPCASQIPSAPAPEDACQRSITLVTEEGATDVCLDQETSSSAASAGTATPAPEASIDEAFVRAAVAGTTPIDQLPLSMAYVPMQSWKETYDGLQALDAGTIFPELDLPFCGRRLSK